MKVLVTGADGFVGSYLVAALADAGHEVIPCHRSGGSAPPWAGEERWRALTWQSLEMGEPASIERVAALASDAVVHLAAVSSGTAARQDPARAWAVNATGTRLLLDALVRGGAAPRTIVVSTGEVYGIGAPRPRTETDPVAPATPYATSKAGAETAAGDVLRNASLPVLIARPFAHTGPGQSTAFVVPAFVARLREARAGGLRRVHTGNLEPVRDLLHVRDVVRAYMALLDPAVPPGTYNVASGQGASLAQVLDRLARLVGVDVVPTTDPGLVRPADIPHLVGDPTRLSRATGWTPRFSLDQTLQDLVNAETH